MRDRKARAIVSGSTLFKMYSISKASGRVCELHPDVFKNEIDPHFPSTVAADLVQSGRILETPFAYYGRELDTLKGSVNGCTLAKFFWRELGA